MAANASGPWRDLDHAQSAMRAMVEYFQSSQCLDELSEFRGDQNLMEEHLTRAQSKILAEHGVDAAEFGGVGGVMRELQMAFPAQRQQVMLMLMTTANAEEEAVSRAAQQNQGGGTDVGETVGQQMQAQERQAQMAAGAADGGSGGMSMGSAPSAAGAQQQQPGAAAGGPPDFDSIMPLLQPADRGACAAKLATVQTFQRAGDGANAQRAMQDFQAALQAALGRISDHDRARAMGIMVASMPKEVQGVMANMVRGQAEIDEAKKEEAPGQSASPFARR